MARPMRPVSPCAPWLCSGTSTPTGLARAATTRLVALRSTTSMASSITPTGSTTCSSPPPWEGENYEPRNPMESDKLQVAEVIAVQILMDRWGAEARGAFSIVGRLLDLIPTVFGNASVESRPVQALRTYEQMVAVVRGTDNPVILYLVSQIGCPLAYELATKGFGLEAANLLTSTVHPLFEVVW